MPLPDSLLLSIAASISHPYDFTFYGHNGEIANRIRAELEKQVPSSFRSVSLDSDNDINVRTRMGTFYVTPNGVTTSGWAVQLKDLQSTPTTEEYSRTIDVLSHVSSSLEIESSSVRLLFRFTPKNPLDLLKTQILEAALQTILADKAPPQISSFKTSAEYQRGQFLDAIELEVLSDEVQFRYHRTMTTGFDSYFGFLQAANLNDLVGDLTSFLETLTTSQPRLRDRIKKS